MNIILSKLINLQRMDTKILKLKNESLKIPKDIDNNLSVFHAKEKQLLDTKNLISELQRLRRDQESEVKAKDAEIAKLNSQLSQISTNKEYSTLIFEIENKKKEKAKIEETELEAMYKIETQEKNIKNEEKIFSEEKNKIDIEKKIKEEELNKIKNIIEEKRQQKIELIKDLPKEILFKYEQILRSKEGIAVAKINFTKEVCLGCHMSLPPQLINEVKPNNKLINCDKCGRFLYWEDETHA